MLPTIGTWEHEGTTIATAAEATVGTAAGTVGG
jgi:hypothetical protein